VLLTIVWINIQENRCRHQKPAIVDEKSDNCLSVGIFMQSIGGNEYYCSLLKVVRCVRKAVVEVAGAGIHERTGHHRLRVPGKSLRSMADFAHLSGDASACRKDWLWDGDHIRQYFERRITSRICDISDFDRVGTVKIYQCLDYFSFFAYTTLR
jgi:hypothetical protein